MVQVLTLVWLSATGLQAHQGDLQAWSRAHQVALRPALEQLSPAYDPATAETIEVQLESHRTALGMQQADVAALERTCQQIVAHPELPQAAWLLAECDRLSALALAQGGDTLAAAQHQRAANALEGPRAGVYSEAAPTLAPLEPVAVVETEIVGPRPTDRVFLDGEPIPSRTLTTVGTHHLRVLRDEAVLWSGWLQVAAQGGPLLVPSAAQPCSSQELSGIEIRSSQVVVPQDVTCTSWAVARPQADGKGIDVWRCRADRCEGPEQWPVPTDRTPDEKSAGAWYVWPLVGVGVALGTAAVLWQTGAFDREQQPDRPFTITGPGADTAAIRF
jgi:hypothetical protein